jgi:hypothetical protein
VNCVAALRFPQPRRKARGSRLPAPENVSWHGVWAIVDLVGKAGYVRTVPVPDWVKSQLGRIVECDGYRLREVVSSGHKVRSGKSTELGTETNRAQCEQPPETSEGTVPSMSRQCSFRY